MWLNIDCWQFELPLSEECWIFAVQWELVFFHPVVCLATFDEPFSPHFSVPLTNVCSFLCNSELLIPLVILIALMIIIATVVTITTTVTNATYCKLQLLSFFFPRYVSVMPDSPHDVSVLWSIFITNPNYCLLTCVSKSNIRNNKTADRKSVV